MKTNINALLERAEVAKSQSNVDELATIAEEVYAFVAQYRLDLTVEELHRLVSISEEMVSVIGKQKQMIKNVAQEQSFSHKVSKKYEEF